MAKAFKCDNCSKLEEGKPRCDVDHTIDDYSYKLQIRTVKDSCYPDFCSDCIIDLPKKAFSNEKSFEKLYINDNKLCLCDYHYKYSGVQPSSIISSKKKCFICNVIKLQSERKKLDELFRLHTGATLIMQ